MSSRQACASPSLPPSWPEESINVSQKAPEGPPAALSYRSCRHTGCGDLAQLTGVTTVQPGPEGLTRSRLSIAALRKPGVSSRALAIVSEKGPKGVDARPCTSIRLLNHRPSTGG